MKPRYMNLRWLRLSITRESSKDWPKRVRYGSSHRPGISGDMTMVLSFLAADCHPCGGGQWEWACGIETAPCVRLCCKTAARPDRLIAVQIQARSSNGRQPCLLRSVQLGRTGIAGLLVATAQRIPYRRAEDGQARSGLFNASGPRRKSIRHGQNASSARPILHRHGADVATCLGSIHTLCACHPSANSRPSTRIRGRVISRPYPPLWEAGVLSSRTQQPEQSDRRRRAPRRPRSSQEMPCLSS